MNRSFNWSYKKAHTNPVGQLPGPLSYKLLDQFTMPMLPTEPQCTNVIACI